MDKNNRLIEDKLPNQNSLFFKKHNHKRYIYHKLKNINHNKKRKPTNRVNNNNLQFKSKFKYKSTSKIKKHNNLVINKLNNQKFKSNNHLLNKKDHNISTLLLFKEMFINQKNHKN